MTTYHPDTVDLAGLRGVLEAHPVHGIQPEGSEYTFGRVHRDRASLKGYSFEARKALRRCLSQARGVSGASRRFLILARPRSGSTLLVDLLTQVADMRCDREVLHYAVSRPVGLLANLASATPYQAYGCKLLSYQMFEIQRLRDPVGFFERLSGLGFSFVHLRRDTFAQSLSLSKALHTGIYEMRNTDERPNEPHEMVIDPAAFRRMVAWNATMLSYEDRLMSGFPHLEVNYEGDLITPDLQQHTVDQICDLIGHPPSPVTARTKSVRGVGARVVNMDVLRREAEAMIGAT